MDEFSPAITNEDRQMLAQARSSFCAFLGLHFMQLPDEELIRQVRGTEFQDLLIALVQDENTHPEISQGAQEMLSFLEQSGDIPTKQLLESLGVDRTRLYRGVSPSYGPPPPYEAVWMPGVVKMTDLLQEIAAIYQSRGLAPAPDANERLDYAGIELAYIERLAQEEASHWAAGEINLALESLAKQEEFLLAHIAIWTPRFVETALEHARTGFYRGHLHMLRGFIQDQLEILVELSKNSGG